MAALAYEVPSSITCVEIEFSRVYRDEAGKVKRERVNGICFGLDFPDFACFRDESRKQPRWIVIHHKSGKSLGDCQYLERIPPYLEAVAMLMNWGNVEGLKRGSPLFEMVSSAAKRFGIENL